MDGYWTLKLYGESYYVHRLVWLLHMGYLPEQLDHIDGNPRNNRIENIRECSNLENARNSKSRSNSRSKFKGVFWNYKKWSAQIRIGKDVRCLGSFLTEEEAAMSYDKAAVNLFGSFAKLNRAERTTV